MRYFYRDGKYNFVDLENRFVGFDANRQCCEAFGWMITRKAPQSLDDDTLWEPNDIGKADLMEGYVFDVHFKDSIDITGTIAGEPVGTAVFRLVKGDEEAFLTLYNAHNGYYSHGFEFRDGLKRLDAGSL